ncbi:hypothetical protein [Arthrobacter sp. NEB 688]|uniref:hypothetical protein n=1 Tax=Arthrobacter sp. NEB 688 TaxID=904039 RepID=UPI00156467D4|nr:hypothetical protein [Arthrobacter sp. NEB 688]QKE83122.1 hypothetical protein HL663_03560 [Arthrobacter sp. NEB 688]
MDTSTPVRTGQRVRPELPATRVVALVVSDLAVAGAPERAAATLHGARFEVEAGTVTVLTPARAGRTVVLCLTGQLARSGGTVETGDGPSRRDVATTSWQLAVTHDPDPAGPAPDTTAADLLAGAGRGAARAAARLGLTPVLQQPVAGLDPAERTLLGVALALADGPDVVALEHPAARLDADDLGRVLDAVRDLVDVDGRTVLLVEDLDRLPAAVHPLVDAVVELGPFLGAP